VLRGGHPHGEIDGDGFRLRGFAHVYRIESLSDAVFAFVVTLLVVSLVVPPTFDDMLQSLSGSVGFALGFALIVQFWAMQNRFFRRYGLHDNATIVLTATLLFLVILFTYPLKFLVRLLADVAYWATPVQAIRPDQIWQLFVLYGVGYAAVFCIFGLLFRHALSLADPLALSPRERVITRSSVERSFGQMVPPAVSILLAVGLHATGNDGVVGPVAGFIYPFAIFAVIWIVKRRLAQALQAAGPEP
jgi:uncharacterized membrane protein